MECHAGTVEEWQAWFEKCGDSEKKVTLIIWKKHTGRPSMSYQDSMDVAICYGWIDTTVRRIDEERYSRTFVRRGKNSRWSKNTLSYGKRLLETGRMNAYGKQMYEEGLLKPTIDHDLPKNPDVPEVLKKALVQEGLLEKFMVLAPSYRRYVIYWVVRAVRTETKERRVGVVIEKLKKGEKVF